MDFLNKQLHHITCISPAGGWSNGKTADSDSAYQGSNPCPPANKIKGCKRNLAALFFFILQLKLAKDQLTLYAAVAKRRRGGRGWKRLLGIAFTSDALLKEAIGNGRSVCR